MWALELIGGNYSKQLGVAIQTTAIPYVKGSFGALLPNNY